MQWGSSHSYRWQQVCPCSSADLDGFLSTPSRHPKGSRLVFGKVKGSLGRYRLNRLASVPTVPNGMSVWPEEFHGWLLFLQKCTHKHTHVSTKVPWYTLIDDHLQCLANVWCITAGWCNHEYWPPFVQTNRLQPSGKHLERHIQLAPAVRGAWQVARDWPGCLCFKLLKYYNIFLQLLLNVRQNITITV